MSGIIVTNRREALAKTVGIGGVLAAVGIPSTATAAGENSVEVASDGVDETLLAFSPPSGKPSIKREGYAEMMEASSVVGVASHQFSFRRADGDAEEKTVAVDRPDGAGFIVMLMNMQYAFMRAATGNTLRERPLGELLARIGMRGDNLVCRVRLTDVNADDPVSIRVAAGVLFFR